MRKQYVIAGEVFETQTAVKKRVQAILARLGPVDKGEFSFLEGLVMLHYDAAEKVGSGIAGFEVRINQPHKTRGVWIRRTDGSETDFSYLECLRPSTNTNRFAAACRTAVAGQIQEFKSAAFALGPVMCPLSGKLLSPENAHVDHLPPTFDELVRELLGLTEIDVETVEFVSGDRLLHVEFLDPDLGRQFADFHRRRARLRLLHKSAHLALPRKKKEDRG